MKPALLALALSALLALARGAATECAAGEHADPLVTYILTAEKAKLSAVDKAKNLYRLTVPLAAAVPTMPYMINSHPGGLEQGVLDTKRFVADWAALCDAADYGKGRYAMPNYAAVTQCQKENLLNVAKAKLSPTAANVMMLIHGSPHAIVADIYNVEVAKGVATFSLRWIKAPKDTPDFGCHAKQDMQKAHYHHRPVSGCELEIAEDIALPGAALREVARGATLFIKAYTPPPFTCDMCQGNPTFDARGGKMYRTFCSEYCECGSCSLFSAYMTTDRPPACDSPPYCNFYTEICCSEQQGATPYTATLDCTYICGGGRRNFP
jgi:hypothetical protein